jgi:hypothetical protein
MDLTWATVVTAAVALYGAGLSTLNFIGQRRRDHRRMRVTLKDDGDETFFQPMVHLHVSNVGHPAVHLAEAAILLPTGEEIIWGGRFASIDELPRGIDAGRNFTATVMVNDLSEALTRKGHGGHVRLRARVIDETGRTYVSRPLKYKIRTWRPREPQQPRTPQRIIPQ